MGDDGRSDTGPNPAARAMLLVVYTERLDACRDFYSDLGLDLVREQHGTGPVHYAVELAAGLVMELYPGAPERTTGRLRLGLAVSASARLPAGEHRLTDPDGRTLTVTAVAPPGEQPAPLRSKAVGRALPTSTTGSGEDPHAPEPAATVGP